MNQISDTQLAAWKAVQSNLGERQEKVFNLILNSDGMTAWEIADTLGVQQNFITGRITELKEMGLIKDSLKRRKSSISRKFQTVYVWSGTFKVEKNKKHSPLAELLDWVEEQLAITYCHENLFCDHCRVHSLVETLRKTKSGKN